MKIVLLIFVCCTFNTVFSRSLIICPGKATQDNKAADEVVKGNLFQTITVRFPKVGDYNGKIHCINVIDENNGHSDPVITAGGLTDSYVEITIRPWLLEELKYRFQIYT